MADYIKLARARQKRDIKDGAERGLWFDKKAADRVVRFFDYLKHHKGEWAGRKFKLEPWQEADIIRPLFGWKREDGTRRFRVGYIELPRKNGKSTLVAACGLFLTGCDREPGAEVYSTATKKDQAKIVWGDAEMFVRGSARMRQHFQTYRNNINVPALGSKFEPLGADSNTLDGLNPHANLIDELHAHKDRTLWDVMITAMGSRRQPLTLAITTAGIYRPDSIAWEQHQHAVQVLDGSLEDDEYFAYIAAADPKDDWTSPKVWAMANPNLGVSVKEDYLEAECKRAKESPSFLNTFLRLHLNIWTAQVTRWLSPQDWDAGDFEPDLDALKGQECFGGLDLASTIDIAALGLVFPDVDGSYDVLVKCWVPRERILERSRRDRVPYDAWVRDGWMVATEGNVVDYNVIRQDIIELGEQYDIQSIGFDRWNATQIVTQLTGDGFEMVPIGQGYRSLSAPSKTFEGLVISHKLYHGGNPVLKWMASNVAIQEDAAGNIKPSKDRSTEKIDGIVGLIMAIDRATRTESDVYEGDGPVAF